ncbi:Fruiting body protein SC3 [Trametes pubescens]|uniref:Hydrophobin n=1 Tax=Trametes pubescens TaxID=154538 RepID=A0A1M2VLX0_TRAPU|nr:Fruiting body protein SC3 [Trametes pubescens]
MIFTHAIALAISVLPLLAAATPLEARGSGSCSTGALQCCESTEKADSAAGSNLLKSLGVVVQDVNVLIGVTCSPITVVGVGSGGSCSAQTVCCDDNSHGGLVSVGCIPVIA